MATLLSKKLLIIALRIVAANTLLKAILSCDHKIRVLNILILSVIERVSIYTKLNYSYTKWLKISRYQVNKEPKKNSKPQPGWYGELGDQLSISHFYVSLVVAT